jgi:hypothetical protein
VTRSAPSTGPKLDPCGADPSRGNARGSYYTHEPSTRKEPSWRPRSTSRDPAELRLCSSGSASATPAVAGSKPASKAGLPPRRRPALAARDGTPGSQQTLERPAGARRGSSSATIDSKTGAALRRRRPRRRPRAGRDPRVRWLRNAAGVAAVPRHPAEGRSQGPASTPPRSP